MAGIKRFQVEHPEWLQVRKDGRFSYGYNQEWYGDDWQRLAGCGPTTATQVISYLLMKEGLVDPSSHADGEEALARMNTVWDYVRPRYGGGLYKSTWWEEGVNRYLEEHQLPYVVRRLPIFPLKGCQYSVDEVVDFVRKGLESDSPVAFLNRHRGQEEGLSTWHWVPIISMSINNDDVRCVVYDEEIERIFSLKRWLRDNVLGGGFLYIERK